MIMKPLLPLFKRVISLWSRHSIPAHAAAIAFYSLLSLTPLLVILVGVAGLIFGREETRDRLIEEIRQATGTETADFLSRIVEQVSVAPEGVWAALLSVLVAWWGASHVFQHLKRALDAIIGEKAALKGATAILRNRVLSMGMALLTGGLTALWLLLETLLKIGQRLTIDWSIPWWLHSLANGFVAWGLLALLLAGLYKLLPAANPRWRELWLGTLVAALLLFMVRRFAGLYIAMSGISSAYGAAGALVALLLWVYFSAQAVLTGALFIAAEREEVQS